MMQPTFLAGLAHVLTTRGGSGALVLLLSAALVRADEAAEAVAQLRQASLRNPLTQPPLNISRSKTRRNSPSRITPAFRRLGTSQPPRKPA